MKIWKNWNIGKLKYRKNRKSANKHLQINPVKGFPIPIPPPLIHITSVLAEDSFSTCQNSTAGPNAPHFHSITSLLHIKNSDI